MKKEKLFVIVIPCHNESALIRNFLDELETILSPTKCCFNIILVDDYSTDSSQEILISYKFMSDKFTLHVIKLLYNMGHQEAIRQGLNYADMIDQNFDGVIVMDGDGEDDPNAIVEMIKIEEFDIVFVERGKRKESLGFKLGYFFYRLLFKLTTGKKISFGNYCMISNDILKAISKQNYFHFASFLSKQNATIQKLKFDRRKRIDGKSKMNYQALLFHGLYSIIEFIEEILSTFILVFIVVFISIIGIGFFVIYSKFITQKAIPGWASSLSISLIIMCLIIISTVIISLLLLSIKKVILQKNQNYDIVK